MPDTSPPTAPPTPPISLAALLAHPDLALRQVAGPLDTDTAVHWVHTSEMADPYPYLLGGELLLSAGVHCTDPSDAAHYDRYAARIVQAGGAALGFGIAPVHDRVPRPLIEACDRYGLPLLEVAPKTPFTTVARAVWQLMAQARHAELRRVAEAQQALAAAAARPDPVPSVLRQLARRLGGYAVLLGSSPEHSAGTSPEPPVRAALDRLAQVVGPGASRPASATDTVSASERFGMGTVPASERLGPETVPASERLGTATVPADDRLGTDCARTLQAPLHTHAPPRAHTPPEAPAHLAAYALAGAPGLALGVVTSARKPGDHTIAGAAAVLLSLLTAEHQGAAQARRSAALVRLLLGERAGDVTPLLGPGPWTVVRGRPTETAGDPGALAAALGSALFDGDRDGVRVVLTAGVAPAAVPGWTLGAGAPVDPAELAVSDVQAMRALGRAEATRSPFVRHGAHAGLGELVPPAEAAAHARALLAPLHRAPNGDVLAETLRTWLSLHGSWDRTATAQGVHRNTVRQRVARCAALLDTDLDDPDVRMELWFALRQGH
ncbi:PucR family transcriptional regulator [Streptomyces sp. TRM66268-LWL]|uniref:PucR family transcriptional regulator n=1 Tax=Streptomyces polyasparticus TaxID=2767826 RepID=A0ABR7SNC7_9ACTN|nr:PucR family transcriptional regulator [Streptomyces polyasparticus]MBC9716986.1 PucR family transcriptional regulator [Streptomyces polyasparticus]